MFADQSLISHIEGHDVLLQNFEILMRLALYRAYSILLLFEIFVFAAYYVWDNDRGTAIREIRIDEAAGRGVSDLRMTCFEVIMRLKLQSTKLSIYSI